MASLIATLRSARRARGLTQAEVARAMGTTQSAVARLERGGVTPTLATVEAYATSVGREVRVARPEPTGTCRDGVADRLAHDDHDGALRAVVQLFDDLLRTPEPGEALAVEPASTGARRWDAAIAATCERAARARGLDPPGWTAAPSRFLPGLWLPVEDVLGHPVSGALASFLLASSPPEFAVRGVLIDPATLRAV